jgi:hypothetical protein
MCVRVPKRSKVCVCCQPQSPPQGRSKPSHAAPSWLLGVLLVAVTWGALYYFVQGDSRSVIDLASHSRPTSQVSTPGETGRAPGTPPVLVVKGRALIQMPGEASPSLGRPETANVYEDGSIALSPNLAKGRFTGQSERKYPCGMHDFYERYHSTEDEGHALLLRAADGGMLHVYSQPGPRMRSRPLFVFECHSGIRRNSVDV